MTSRRRYLLIPLLGLCLLLLTGCDLPWPLNRIGGGGKESGEREVYVASMITRNLLQQDGLVIAVEPQASTFYEGEVVLFVLNKWSGLAVGDHAQAAVVMTEQGEQVGREETAFTTTESDLTATLVEPFQFDSLRPGRYWIVIELDGAEQVRYRFQVIPREG